MAGQYGLRVEGLNFANVADEEFNRWNDSAYLPARQRIPGLRNAQRWINFENSKISIATFDLDNLGVLQSAGDARPPAPILRSR